MEKDDRTALWIPRLHDVKLGAAATRDVLTLHEVLLVAPFGQRQGMFHFDDLSKIFQEHQVVVGPNPRSFAEEAANLVGANQEPGSKGHAGAIIRRPFFARAKNGQS
jgi:hypothetical protein